MRSAGLLLPEGRRTSARPIPLSCVPAQDGRDRLNAVGAIHDPMPVGRLTVGSTRNGAAVYSCVAEHPSCRGAHVYADGVMKTVHAGNGVATLVLDGTELRLLQSSLNEVCNGIDIDAIEFPTRIGVSLEYARQLLSDLGRIIDDAD